MDRIQAQMPFQNWGSYYTVSQQERIKFISLIRKLWHICTMEHYSSIKRNTSESVLMRWMNLGPIKQREVRQKEKDKYHILTHIYGIRKMIPTALHAGQQKRDRCKEQTFGFSGRRREWDDLRE